MAAPLLPLGVILLCAVFGGKIRAQGIAPPRVDTVNSRLQPPAPFETPSLDGRGPHVEPLPPAAETLDDAWAMAQQADLTLQAMIIQKKAHDQEFGAARAQRWPNASIDGVYSWRSDELSFQIPSPIVPNAYTEVPYLPSDQLLVRGYLNAPLYTGHRITHNIAAAAARTEAQHHRIVRSQRDLKLRVIEEYVGVLRAQHELAAAESEVQNLKAQIADTRALVESGQASRGNLLAAESALSDAEHTAFLAYHSLDLARAIYNQRVGQPLDRPVMLQPLQAPVQTLDLEQLTRRAISHGTVRQELRAQAQALRYEAAAIRSRSKPQVHLFGGYAYAENPYQDPQTLAEAAIGVSWNVFDAGTGRRRARARELTAAATISSLADAEAHIEIEVRRAWLEWQAAQKCLSVTSKSAQLAEEQHRASHVRLASGFANASDVVRSESRKVQAMRRYYNAQCDAVLAHARLMHIAGDL